MNSPLRLPLLVSLTLNLLLLGIVAGHFLNPPPPPPSYQQQRMDAVEEVAQQLPEAKAAHLRETMAKGQEDVAELKKSMKEARTRTMEILAAEPFDATAYQEETAKLHALRGQMMQRMANAMMEAAEGLEASERALLAHTFQRYHGYWKKCEPLPKKTP